MKIDDKLASFDIKNKKNIIEKEIKEYEDKKSKMIFELGIAAYEKIRNGAIEKALFSDICLEIKKIDLEIYNRMLDIKELEQKNGLNTCDCGAVLNKDDKFCSKCGKSIEVDMKNVILCDVCASKIDADSNFCVCCGSKVQKYDFEYEAYEREEYIEDSDDEVEKIEKELEESILEMRYTEDSIVETKDIEDIDEPYLNEETKVNISEENLDEILENDLLKLDKN